MYQEFPIPARGQGVSVTYSPGCGIYPERARSRARGPDVLITHLSMLAPTPPSWERWGKAGDLTWLEFNCPTHRAMLEFKSWWDTRCVFRMHTLVIQYSDPWGKPAIPNKKNSPPCPGCGGWGLTLIGALRWAACAPKHKKHVWPARPVCTYPQVLAYNYRQVFDN